MAESPGSSGIYLWLISGIYRIASSPLLSYTRALSLAFFPDFTRWLMRISAEQLQRFSRECLILRRALQDGAAIPDGDYALIQSGVRLLLGEIDKSWGQQTASQRSTDSPFHP